MDDTTAPVLSPDPAATGPVPATRPPQNFGASVGTVTTATGTVMTVTTKSGTTVVFTPRSS
jgi:hypothetical protein